MYGYRLGTVTFDSFDVLLGLALFATVYVAGMTSVSGGVLAGALAAGGLVYYAGSQWLSLDVAWYQILTGVALVASVIKNPEGLVGTVHHALGRRRARRRPAPDVPSLPALTRAPLAKRAGTALAVRDLVVRYGGVLAVDGASFAVPRGTIVGLIGPNGAGKTTVIDAVSGFAPYSGAVLLDDSPLDGHSPYRRVRRGLARTFQGIELWNELTVSENVLIGPRTAARRSDDVDALFALLELSELRDRPASELSQGQRQLVSIARALVGRPDVVLLDEPAAGLDSAESEWLADKLREIRGDGTTILLVDHDMNLVLNLCDHIEVLDFGRIIASGEPNDIRTSAVVADAYLGTMHAAREVGAS
jgi:ABC-type branched-subunit amino acid transport system ATPase component